MTDEEKIVCKDHIVEYLKRFPFYKWAAKSVAIDDETLKNWRDADDDFSHRVEIARAEGIKYFGGRATPDLILKSADPQTFKEQKEFNVNVTSQMTDDQLNQLIQSKIGQVGVAQSTSGERKSDEKESTEVCNPTSETA